MGLDSFFKPLLDFLKQPGMYIGLGVSMGLALFIPDSIISRLGLLEYRNKGKPYFAAILLLCIAITITNAIGFAVGKYNGYRLRRAREQRLHRLTVEEKQVLRLYIEGQTRSTYLNLTSGVVNGLEAASIIYRSSTLGRLSSGFAYNIQPWAWEYLNKHRDLLR